MPLDLLVLGGDVEARHTSFAGGRLIEPREHVHRGGLTGSVRPEETEDLPSAYRERDVIHGMESAEGFDQMLYLDDVLLTLLTGGQRGQSGGIEDIGKGGQYLVRRTDTAYLAMIEESYPFAATHLVQIGRRGDDGQSSLPQRSEHFPQFLAADGIDTGGGFIEDEHAGLMDQRARER